MLIDLFINCSLSRQALDKLYRSLTKIKQESKDPFHIMFNLDVCESDLPGIGIGFSNAVPLWCSILHSMLRVQFKLQAKLG